MKTIEIRPANGCARCFWWKQHQNSVWGRCALSGEDRGYKSPPCYEYEMDPEVQDEIIISE